VLAAGFVVYELQGGTSIPMRDSHPSVSSILIQLTILVSVVVMAGSLRRYNPEYVEVKPTDRMAVVFRWFSRAATMLAITFVVTLVVVLILFAIARSMGDRTVPAEVILISSAIFAAGMGFALAYWTCELTYQELFWFTSVAMVLGLAGAIILAPDNAWWTGVLSFLGIGPSGWVFDLTFIVGGLLLLIVIDDKLDDLKILRDSGAFESAHFGGYRIVLTAQCIAMIGIGLFPFTGITLRLHQIFSFYSVLSFLLIAPAFIWLLPIYSHTVRLLATLPTVLGMLVVAGYFIFSLDFTLVELIFIGLIMLWVGVFYYATRAYILKLNPALDKD